MKKDNTKSLKKRLPAHLQQINLNAAGIDIGSQSHFVAVPDGRDETRRYKITRCSTFNLCYKLSLV